MFGVHLPPGLTSCTNHTMAGLDDIMYQPEVVEKCSAACPEPCTESRYDVTSVSEREWPGMLSFDTTWLLSNFAPGPDGGGTDQENYDYLRRTTLQFDVVMETTAVENLVSTPKYTWGVLLSHVGGVLALFLGCSVLVALELAELIFDLGSHIYSRRKVSQNISGSTSSGLSKENSITSLPMSQVEA